MNWTWVCLNVNEYSASKLNKKKNDVDLNVKVYHWTDFVEKWIADRAELNRKCMFYINQKKIIISISENIYQTIFYFIPSFSLSLSPPIESYCIDILLKKFCLLVALFNINCKHWNIVYFVREKESFFFIVKTSDFQ